MKRVLKITLASLSLLALSTASGGDQPKLTLSKGGQSTWNLDWQGVAGHTYFTQWSENLVDWKFFPTVLSGDGSVISHGFSSSSDKFFTRVEWTDLPDGGDPNIADFDKDGLGSLEELLSVNQTDPLNDDTDGDQLIDGWEVRYGLLPNNSDSDGNGIPDGLEDPDGDGSDNATEQSQEGDPYDPIDSGQMPLEVIGWGDQGVEVTNPTPLYQYQIPAGSRSYLVVAYVHSEEYPLFTANQSEFDDVLRWDIDPSNGDQITGSVSVNTLHDQWVQSETEGTSYLDYSPIAEKVLGVVNASPTGTVTVDVEIGITNIADGDYWTTALIRLVPMALAVDANRDGQIEFGTDMPSETSPYRFWINNDRDINEDEEDVAEQEDHSDEFILTQRDLEDFSRLHLYIDGLHNVLKSGEVTATIKFKDGSTEGNPAVNLWLHLDKDGDRDYLLKEVVANRHLNLSNPGRITKDNGYTFSTEFWSGEGIENYSSITKAKPYRYLLFEGAGIGKGELVIEFKAGNDNLGEGCSCWINLLDVRNMYERVKVTPDGPDQFTHPYYWGGQVSEIYAEPPVPAIGWVSDPFGYNFIPDPDEEKEYIVFVHGWRMTYSGAQKYGETMYKRLWQSGYKGRYTFIRWPTYSEQTNPVTNALFTYNDSDYRAWISGKGVASYVNSLNTKYSRNIAAHSMGNVVVSSALREGMQVENYALLNAAIPAMCYDGNALIHEFNFDTPDTDNDPVTQALGFKNKIAQTNGANLINFYLEDDSALATWETNNQLFKPQRVGAVGYSYDENGDAGEKAKLTLGVIEEVSYRYPRSYYEAAAFITQSKTKAVGAEWATNGSINDKVDMDDKYGFDDIHSAQWILRFQKTDRFFYDLLDKFNLDPN